MTEEPVYVLDANVLIQAKRLHYRFDVCPGFWEALIAFHSRGLVQSIDRVRKELVDYGDELSDWVKTTAPKSFFQSTNNTDCVSQYRDVNRWVESRDQYLPAAKSKFASCADSWLIAFSKINGYVLVTHEEGAEYSKKRVKIPDVCNEFGVQIANTYEMLASLGVSFSWHS